MQNLNYLLSNFQVSGAAIFTPEVEIEPGTSSIWDVLIESVNGSPSAASLACKFQVAPIEYNGYNMNYDPTSGVQIPWIDVAAGDGYLGHLLQDGAWPTSLADQTLSAHRLVSRRLIVPAIGRLVRLALTPAFTGGTSPNFRVSVACSVPQ